MELGKVPPHDEDAEQAVLGGMLTDNDAVMAAVEVLKEDAFYREDNRAIYQAIVNLYSKSEPIDIITLKEQSTDHKAVKEALSKVIKRVEFVDRTILEY